MDPVQKLPRHGCVPSRDGGGEHGIGDQQDHGLANVLRCGYPRPAERSGSMAPGLGRRHDHCHGQDDTQVELGEACDEEDED